MKTTMKKTAAYLLALILVLQITPVFAAATYSGVYTPGNVIYRDRLEIITNDAGIMTVGQKIQLSITAGYENPVWESNHPEIATVDSTGLVEAVAAGQVKITVSSDGYTDSVTLRVVGEAAANQNDGDTEKIIVIVNCAKSKVEYDGATHTNTFSMTSTNPRFDASKVTLVTEGHQAVGTACGAYTDSLTADDFRYEGEEVEFVVSNGWMQIKPKDITIKADDLTIREGENPAYTATVTEGLVEGEALDLSAMTFTVDGENIYPDVEKGEIIGNYKVAKVISGKLAVITSQPLYNIAMIRDANNKEVYYRLAKTEIWTEFKPENPNFGKTLKTDEYTADPYDFSKLTITIDNTDYVYKCPENAEAILKGANYYEVKSTKVSIIKEKIGAMDGNNPRWLVPEDQRYNDPNKLNSIHRDYELKLHKGESVVTEQRAYNFVSVDGSNNYHKLPTTSITAKPLDQCSMGTLAEGEYILERYDFSDTVITIDGVEYRYNDGSLTEYDNYYTISFEDVQKTDRFNKDNDWYKKEESWLDGAYEEYGDMPNSTTVFHANYLATTHKAEKTNKRVTISSDWPSDQLGYIGLRITLTAHLEGFERLTEGVDYKLQWQYSEDKENWKDVIGANDISHTFTLNETTTHYSWRVCVIDLK